MLAGRGVESLLPHGSVFACVPGMTTLTSYRHTTSRAPTPAQLSRQLREDDTPDLRRRRWIIRLSLIGMLAGKIVSLYQMGMLRHLPEPPFIGGPGRLFDADRVDKAPYAYKRLRMPDALLMLVSYSVTAALAGAGGRDRATREGPASRWIPIAMAGKALADTAVALKLGREEWQSRKALCWYCQTATVVSLVSTILAMPEAIKAIRGR